jgi:hypothetical protein
MKKFLVVLKVLGIVALTLAFTLALNIGLCALVIYVASMIFKFAFNWWYVIGLAAGIALLKGTFNVRVKVDKS